MTPAGRRMANSELIAAYLQIERRSHDSEKVALQKRVARLEEQNAALSQELETLRPTPEHEDISPAVADVLNRLGGKQ